VRRAVFALVLGFLAALPATAQVVNERLPTCLACHGENGQSQNPGVPSLGAQQAYYVTVQLLMFRDRMRVADPMNDMAQGLADDDLGRFGRRHCQAAGAAPPAGAVDDARMARARALVEENRCDFCHTPSFAGQQNVRALPTSARIIWSRRCAAIRTTPAAATTPRWRTWSRRSATSRFWIWPITLARVK